MLKWGRQRAGCISRQTYHASQAWTGGGRRSMRAAFALAPFALMCLDNETATKGRGRWVGVASLYFLFSRKKDRLSWTLMRAAYLVTGERRVAWLHANLARPSQRSPRCIFQNAAHSIWVVPRHFTSVLDPGLQRPRLRLKGKRFVEKKKREV